jgi:hypothetical protein
MEMIRWQDLVTAAAPQQATLENVRASWRALHAASATIATGFAADGLCGPCPPVARRTLH